LLDTPDLATDGPYAACAAGNEAALEQMAAADPGWVNRPGGPFALPPLVAVTHSILAQVPEFRDRLYRSAQSLLQAGADPNDGESLYHSLENPDCTRMLLLRGARVSGTNALRRARSAARTNDSIFMEWPSRHCEFAPAFGRP
jgi:hypothetical protein